MKHKSEDEEAPTASKLNEEANRETGSSKYPIGLELNGQKSESSNQRGTLLESVSPDLGDVRVLEKLKECSGGNLPPSLQLQTLNVLERQRELIKSYKEAICSDLTYRSVGKTLVPVLSSLPTPASLLPTNILNYWKDALIARATGNLLGLWKLHAEPRIQHLGSNFFVVHNLKSEYRIKILTSSWRIGKDPLLIQTWKQDFRLPFRLKELRTSTWLYLPFLPVEYHSSHALISLGNSIRKPVALDKARTLQLTKARICVELDLGRQLPQVISINNHQQPRLMGNYLLN